MNEKHGVERDIALTFDFLRYVVDHPEMIDGIPEGAEIEFISSDMTSTGPAGDQGHTGRRSLIEVRRVFELLSAYQ